MLSMTPKLKELIERYRERYRKNPTCNIKLSGNLVREPSLPELSERYPLPNKIKIYGPCYICGNDNEKELNFESFIHHNGEVRCKDLKSCRRRQRKMK